MVLADAIILSAVRRLIIGLLSFFLWDFQALDCQRQARIVLVRRYCGDHPHHYGSYVAVAEVDVIEFMDASVRRSRYFFFGIVLRIPIEVVFLFGECDARGTDGAR
jgi:hypothetical protein